LRFDLFTHGDPPLAYGDSQDEAKRMNLR
jgi:hypothetical protein